MTITISGRPRVSTTRHGVYDLGRDTGWVNVGTDRNTAAFAAESIRRWWNGQGRLDYPGATRLLITADAGGANSADSTLFKMDLAVLADDSGLYITIMHFPPGTQCRCLSRASSSR
ncbi:hypothetical protein GCM10009647_083220 [Streptomyces sanglieri]